MGRQCVRNVLEQGSTIARLNAKDSNVQVGDQGPASFLKIAGWGCYLAMSWTWCIGMWLPVILLRDLGVWSFLIFALPNCIGAAAMGGAIASPTASVRFVERHGLMCHTFAWVTLAFQVFFLASMLGLSPLFFGVAGLVVGAGWMLGKVRSRGRVGVAWVVLAVSLGMLAWFVLSTGDGGEVGGLSEVHHKPLDLVGLACVCVMGFMLCPYLDPTFHHARQRFADKQQSVSAFGIGFCIIFATMIAGTLVYGSQLLAGAQAEGSVLHPTLLALPIVIHIAVQAVFTGTEHARSMGASVGGSMGGASVKGTDSRRIVSILTAVACGVVVAMIPLNVDRALLGHLTDFEVKYRLFLAFYGLIAPAYLWICSDWSDWKREETWSKHTGEDRRVWMTRWVVCLIALTFAGPMFWIGFIHREYAMLIPGVGIILLARPVARALSGYLSGSRALQ